MTRKIIWSPLSEEDFENILIYLETEWDAEVAIKFIDLVDVLLVQIANNPKHYPLIHKKYNIRKCVITKHNTLYYRSSKRHVELLRIYDNRQDPDKLKFK